MKESELTRFFSNETRYVEFEEMLGNITNEFSIEPEIVKKCAHNALEKWEKETNSSLLNVFMLSFERRSQEISKMIHHLREEFRPYIGSSNNLNRISSIATKTFENLYQIFSL